jgi:hypothetical protein
MWETFLQAEEFISFHEKFCHRELLGTYNIKEVILQMFGEERC